MKRATIYRVTGIFLSLTVALLGASVAILLYFAGQAALDLFYKDSIYMDEDRRIHKKMPTDDWYGDLVLRGWAFGFIYVVPGLSGITASLFFNKCVTVVHVTIGVLAIFVGSFLHTAGGIGLIMYRLLFVEGAVRYNPWLGDCIYVRDGEDEYEDQRCLTGRRALLLSIAGASLALISWIFLLAEILYTAFTFHNIGKLQGQKKKHTDDEEPQYERRRRWIPFLRRAKRPDSDAPTLPYRQQINFGPSTSDAETGVNKGFTEDEHQVEDAEADTKQVNAEGLELVKL